MSSSYTKLREEYNRLNRDNLFFMICFIILLSTTIGFFLMWLDVKDESDCSSGYTCEKIQEPMLCLQYVPLFSGHRYLSNQTGYFLNGTEIPRCKK